MYWWECNTYYNVVTASAFLRNLDFADGSILRGGVAAANVNFTADFLSCFSARAAVQYPQIAHVEEDIFTTKDTKSTQQNRLAQTFAFFVSFVVKIGSRLGCAVLSARKNSSPNVRARDGLHSRQGGGKLN
jgi:hypothetical protein